MKLSENVKIGMLMLIAGAGYMFWEQAGKAGDGVQGVRKRQKVTGARGEEATTREADLADAFMYEEMMWPQLQLTVQMPSAYNTTTFVQPTPDFTGTGWAGDFVKVRLALAEFHARDRIGGLGSLALGDRNTGEPIRFVPNQVTRTPVNEIF